MTAEVRWFDDWYAIEAIAPGLYAIGEPKYHQINWNYLIEGRDAALLFDTGPGVRDIAPVVASLTDRPLTVMPSHLHYDHTGNLHRFDNLAMADLPILRACVRDGKFHAPDHLYLGHHEDMTWRPVSISHWWPIGYVIDLGGVRLEIIHTPGHSPDSVSLLDRERNILLAADFLYPGPLYAQVPGSSLPDYLAAGEALLPRLDPGITILSAHGEPDGTAPRLGKPDLNRLLTALDEIRQGRRKPAKTGPDSYEISDKMQLLVSPEAYGAWR
jgi:glyoxylase-like metal-dependent hydrolase (beta-lactamase superfamily II)